MGKKFTCAACGEDFISEREDGAAKEALIANFGDDPNFDGKYDTLCDACNEEFWDWMATAYPEVKRKD